MSQIIGVCFHPSRLPLGFEGQGLGVRRRGRGKTEKWDSPLVLEFGPILAWRFCGRRQVNPAPGLLLQSHAVVIAAVWGFALSCWNTQDLPWNRRHLEGSICCSKTFTYISAFQNMQTAHTVCPYRPPCHQRCWLLNWTLITRWKGSLLFSPEDAASVISYKNV